MPVYPNRYAHLLNLDVNSIQFNSVYLALLEEVVVRYLKFTALICLVWALSGDFELAAAATRQQSEKNLLENVNGFSRVCPTRWIPALVATNLRVGLNALFRLYKKEHPPSLQLLAYLHPTKNSCPRLCGRRRV